MYLLPKTTIKKLDEKGGNSFGKGVWIKENTI
jgi:hypothetical protein